MNIKLDPVIKKILIERGIDTPERVAEFFSPVPKSTYDPFLYKNMDAVCDRIIKAAEDKERICVYGDYDADGVTAVTLLMEILGCMTDNLTYYIPSRFEEGYGLNMKAVDRMHKDGVSLVVTVDTGCTARKEAEYIKELGMEIIVTDHHQVDPERMPDCLMIDAKQPGETYPYKDLCGCGVAFKLAQALKARVDIPRNVLNHCLDLTGVATVADVVPLTDENRTLVKYGMDRIRKQERPGMNALLKAASIDPYKLSSYNISFGIAPRINSAGRLETADIGVKLLSSSEKNRAEKYADKLESLNKERRALQESIYEAAVEYIESNMPDDPFIVYRAENAHEGVTGIAAGKLKEHYNKPVIIMTPSKEAGFLKGTGRSIEGVDIFSLLNAHVDLFEKFGGHAAACGFTIGEENGRKLRAILNEDMKEILEKKPDLLEKKMRPDAVLRAEEISYELAAQLELMEPFGCGNEKPVFMIEGLSVTRVFSMGSNGQYRKYVCSVQSRNLDAVVFDTDIDQYDLVTAGDTLDVIAEISLNRWNGRTSLQLIIKEISVRY
ncbi:MAG: single-stranded-DNA-specific exonuclease RecJ [Anaerovoracaceae bacterium]|nr:single-stranded-DNA-specific exonuclease RecJ [Bacillota bacterium]MDY2670258.1 single-stranded-DNA-specific exonuclease RecJ [Anaerovoracaceae bacterium]